MILLTFQAGAGGLRLGIKTEAGVIDAGVAGAPGDFYARGLDALPELRRLAEADEPALLDEAALTLGPALPRPGKIICIGRNYGAHAAETNSALPDHPILFAKYQNAVAAPGEDIPLNPAAEQYDYEAELAVVIGRQARRVPEDRALDYVLGYCNANDISARDLQFRTAQWLLGKSLDRCLPLGPYLVTADQVGDPQALPVRCWLNDELRQDSNTGHMIFPVAHLISYISRYITLEPGDIISTGTPEGVIHGTEDKVWMKPGDVVTVEIGPLGRLSNRLTAG